MTRSLRSLVALALLGGCAADTSGAGGDYVDDDIDSKADAYGGGTAPLRGVITNLDHSADPDVQICADRLDRHLRSVGEAPVCTTTDAAGSYVLPLRAFARYELVLTKAGQTTATTLFRTGFLATEFFASLVDENVVPVLYALAGSSYDPTKGTVLGDAYIRDVEDGTEPPPGPEAVHVLAEMAFAIVDSESPAVYLNDQSLPDPTLTVTTAAGVAVFGNVEPGDHDAMISGRPADLRCAREHKPIGSVPGTERVRVHAATLGSFWFRCAEDN